MTLPVYVSRDTTYPPDRPLHGGDRQETPRQGDHVRWSFRAGHLLANLGPNWNDDAELVDSEAGRLKSGDASTGYSEPGLFGPKDVWLHRLYILAFAFAVSGLFLGVRSRAAAIAGLGGLAATAWFLVGFRAFIEAEAGEYGRQAVLRPEVGAVLAALGFAGLSVIGVRRMIRSRRGAARTGA